MDKIIDMTLGWALQPWRLPDNRIMYFLNKYHKGRVCGKITLDKRELKRLRQFLNERKIK